MIKKIATVLLVLAPSAVLADNVGTCGWGAKLMEGNSGIAPQVLAVTTNGTSGNQTFGITSGTSGCTQDGVVHSTWKTALFIDGNMDRLARDMSVGQGESIDSLAGLLGMDAGHKSLFSKVAKENFGSIFPTADVSSQQVLASLKGVLSQNSDLAQYANAL